MICEIKTPRGLIEISKVSEEKLKRIQSLLTYGVLPLSETFRGANYGIVMKCGEQEVLCLKQQPKEMEKSRAYNLLGSHSLMIVDAYCGYIKRGFKGAYLASPYLRQRSNGLWESGISHFIFPDKEDTAFSKEASSLYYDSVWGNGATNMFFAFYECFKHSFKSINIPMPIYFGFDIRPHSHLQSLAMNFMVVDDEVFCLRENLVENDTAWLLLADVGIKKVYHLPSIPHEIDETDLQLSKG